MDLSNKKYFFDQYNDVWYMIPYDKRGEWIKLRDENSEEISSYDEYILDIDIDQYSFENPEPITLPEKIEEKMIEKIRNFDDFLNESKSIYGGTEITDKNIPNLQEEWEENEENNSGKYFIITFADNSGDEIHFWLMDIHHYEYVHNTIEQGGCEEEEFMEFVDNNALDQKMVQTYTEIDWFGNYDIEKVVYIPEFGM